jgi:hypothetical protein
LPGFTGEPIGSKSWVGVSKGQFEKTGVCGRQEYERTGLRKQVYAGGRRNVQGPRCQARDSSKPMGAGQHPFLLPSGPYIIVILTANSFYLATCSRWFLARPIFDPEDGGDVPPKRRFIYGLHGVISQKMAIFITTAVRTSNRTQFKRVVYIFDV